MNEIRFELEWAAVHHSEPGVVVSIDGESLIDTICRLETPWWSSRDTPQPPGQYVWVPARVALPPRRHLLGEPADSWCGEFSPVVVCNCGEYACRAYAVRIEIAGGQVKWSEWAEFPPDEPRIGAVLRPLVFDFARYNAELQRTGDEYRRSTGYELRT